MFNIFNKLSIKVVNYTLFLLVLYNSIIFFIYFDLFKKYNLYFFIINLLLVSLFFIINKFFEIDYNNGKEYIRNFNGLFFKKNNFSEKNNLLNKNLKFKENKDFYKLFKYSILNTNLIKRDYDNLRNLLNKVTSNKVIYEYWGEKNIERIKLGMFGYQNLYVIFLDIINFTKISEKLTPEKTLKLLNIYFDGIIEIINNYGGIIDKFLGDGIMIIFPETIKADNILECCIKIEEYIKKINLGNKNKIFIGIGINYGKVIMGTVGSKDRMEITFIGDVVNTAAKLEQTTRKQKQKILFTKDFYNKLIDKEKINIKNLGIIKIIGKDKKIEIFGI